MTSDYKERKSMENINELKEQVQKGKLFNYTFFWGHRQKSEESVDKSCFSQWFPQGFSLDEVYYPTAEHYMMAEKARLFDASMVDQILKAKTTKEVKALGREVKNFNDKEWSSKSFDIVVKGNLAKFTQHKELQAFLLSTSDKVIVEASPYDKVWGIGMLQDDEKAAKPLEWRGLNKLGFALMVVRDRLQMNMEKVKDKKC